MNKFRYVVSLRISHPDMNPDDICHKLNMKAKIRWRAGAMRKTPKGASLPGVYDQSYCCFDLKQPENIELADFLKQWNFKLLKYEEFLNHIYSSGGRIEYFIGWFSEGNSEEVFDVSLLSDLVKLKIDLSIDFYGGKDD